MLYRKQAWGPRKYSNFNNQDKKIFNLGDELTNSSDKLEDIPLPNEKESPVKSERGKEERKSLFSIDFIKNKIHMEELILIGLILLLLMEGIEDDFIIILLVYILLF